MHALHAEVQIDVFLRRELLAQRRGDAVGVGLRLCHRHARLQAADDAERAGAARRGVEVEAHRRPDVDVRLDAGTRRKQQFEIRGQHANDFGAAVTKADRLADDVRIAAVASLPQPMAQNRQRRQRRWSSRSGRRRARRWWRRLRLRGAVGVGEVAARGHRHAEHREDVGRGADRADLFRFAGLSGDRGATRRGDAGHAVERLGALAEVADIGNREREVEHVARPQLGPHEHEARGIAVGQRPQQDAVDDAEDRRAGADAEGDRQNRDDSESRVFLERAQCVIEILQKGVHSSPQPSLAKLPWLLQRRCIGTFRTRSKSLSGRRRRLLRDHLPGRGTRRSESGRASLGGHSTRVGASLRRRATRCGRPRLRPGIARPRGSAKTRKRRRAS